MTDLIELAADCRAMTAEPVGFNPTREAMADVRRYMAGRVTLDRTKLLLGLSAVSTGLDQVKRGETEAGHAVAAHGLEFLRGMLGGARG